MAERFLDVRIDGFVEPVGAIYADDYGSLTFAYREAYAATLNALPLSLSLPLQEEPFADENARPYFANLLQERSETVERVIAREGLAVGDVAGLLYHLGADCPGAVSVLPHGSPPAKVPGNLETDYDIITDGDLIGIVQAMHERRPLPDAANDPSPLAGVQSKIALTVLPDGSWAQPRVNTGAPTTHILKVSGRAHPKETVYETAILKLSQAFGIDTTDATSLELGGINTILVTRYDRALGADGLVYRLHQEDFAQALGLPPSLKYEREGRTGRRFDADGIAKIIAATALPAQSRRTFLRSVLFDLITGNTDAHAKNFSLLYENDAPSLSPRYDLVPIGLFPDLTDELSFTIGEARRIADVDRNDFDAFLATIGVALPAARKRLLDEEFGRFQTLFGAAMEALDEDGLKILADLVAANIRQLANGLDLKSPAWADRRDAAIRTGGGWLMS